MRINRRQEEILNFLSRNKRKKFSVKEIAEKFGLSYNTASRYLRELNENKLIHRFFGKEKGRGLLYSYPLPENLDPKKNLDALYMDVSPRILDELFNSWSKSRWNPKIFKSARNLPMALARLYHLASEASYGSKIEPEDLAEVKRSLNSFKQDLESILKLINGILLNENLWNNKRFASYLQEGTDTPVDEFILKAEEIRKIN